MYDHGFGRAESAIPAQAFGVGMRILEILLAGFAAIAAGWASWNWWTYLHSATYAAAFRGDSVWPLPAGYLLEMTVLGVAGLVSVSVDRTSSLPLWGNVTWAIAGVFLSLAVLGAWSIGPSVVPALLALVAAGILAGVRRRQKVSTQVGWFAGGVIGQAVIMLLVIVFAQVGYPLDSGDYKIRWLAIGGPRRGLPIAPCFQACDGHGACVIFDRPET